MKYFRNRLDADTSSYLSEQIAVLQSGNGTDNICIRSHWPKRIWTVEALSSEIMHYIKKHTHPRATGTAYPHNLLSTQQSHKRRHRHPHLDQESHRTVYDPNLVSHRRVPVFAANRPEVPNEVHHMRHQSHSEPHYDRPFPSSHLRNEYIHRSTKDGKTRQESPNIIHSRHSHSHPKAAPASYISSGRRASGSGYTAGVFRPKWLNIIDPGPMVQHSSSSSRQHDPASMSHHVSVPRY